MIQSLELLPEQTEQLLTTVRQLVLEPPKPRPRKLAPATKVDATRIARLAFADADAYVPAVYDGLCRMNRSPETPSVVADWRQRARMLGQQLNWRLVSFEPDLRLTSASRRVSLPAANGSQGLVANAEVLHYSGSLQVGRQALTLDGTSPYITLDAGTPIINKSGGSMRAVFVPGRNSLTVESFRTHYSQEIAGWMPGVSADSQPFEYALAVTAILHGQHH